MNEHSTFAYLVSGALIADWFVPFLHNVNEFAPAIGVFLGLATFIVTCFKKGKA